MRRLSDHLPGDSGDYQVIDQVTLLTLQVIQVTWLTLQVTLGVMLLKLLHLENFCPRLRKASTLEATFMFMFSKQSKQCSFHLLSKHILKVRNCFHFNLWLRPRIYRFASKDQILAAHSPADCSLNCSFNCGVKSGCALPCRAENI